MRIYLATWLEDNQGKTLTKVDYKNRLLSFFFIQNATYQFDLETYVREGVLKPRNEDLLRKPRD